MIKWRRVGGKLTWYDACSPQHELQKGLGVHLAAGTSDSWYFIIEKIGIKKKIIIHSDTEVLPLEVCTVQLAAQHGGTLHSKDITLDHQKTSRRLHLVLETSMCLISAQHDQLHLISKICEILLYHPVMNYSFLSPLCQCFVAREREKERERGGQCSALEGSRLPCVLSDC